MKSKLTNAFASLLLLLGANLATQAQTKIVKGRISDDKNAPISSASVVVKGGSGTSTSVTGEFSLTVPDSATTLDVSAVGYGSTSVPITERLISVQLFPEASNLNEIVVIGYGTQKKEDLTAPITTVNMNEAAKRTVSTPMDALQGSVPGVQIVSNGAPGTSPDVRIRGIGSINNSNPLYVVDGMFVNDIGFLNTNDIADMSVLKDASGAAIYGVRAANGVVIITTKKGKFNMKTQVTYNGYVGFQKPTNVPKMAGGQQYINYALQWRTPGDSGAIRESAILYGGSGLAPTTSTDWYKAILRNDALITNHGVDLQGGSDKISYSLGANYTYQNGVMNANNDYNRYNIRFQMEARAYSWLKVGISTILNNSTTFLPNNNAFLTAFTASPLFPIYDSTNTNAFPVKYGNSSFIGRDDPNAVAQAAYNYNRIKLFQVLPTIYAEANFWHNRFTFRSQLSQLYSSSLTTKYSSRNNLGPGAGNVSVSNLASAQERNTNYILDNLLTYKDGMGSHHWTVLLGQSSREERWRQTSVGADNVPNVEEFWYAGQGDKNVSYYNENGFRNAGLSFFARGTYDFENKYLLTATYRADGSSKYQTKWGYFPSIGVGWVISRENFMRSQKIFDFLKLRGSWGKLGNDGVTPNAAYSILTPGDPGSSIFNSTGTSTGGYVPGYTVNNFYTNVTWEVVTEWDGGVDFEVLKSKLKGSVDYYNRATNGAALNRSFAFGAPQIYGNWANMSNKGLDVTLSWSDRIGQLGYQIQGNLSTLNNKVTNIGSLANIPGGFPEWTAEFPNRIEVGQPIYYFFGYQVAGVYQTQADIDKDPVASSANATVPG
jgi:TonB-linked SusC/RagA family outer membrane protein